MFFAHYLSVLITSLCVERALGAVAREETLNEGSLARDSLLSREEQVASLSKSAPGTFRTSVAYRTIDSNAARALFTPKYLKEKYGSLRDVLRIDNRFSLIRDVKMTTAGRPFDNGKKIMLFQKQHYEIHKLPEKDADGTSFYTIFGQLGEEE